MKFKISFEVSQESYILYQKWRAAQGEPFASNRLERIFTRAIQTDGAGGPFSTLKNAGKSALFSFLENTVNNARKETLKQLPRKDPSKT